LETELRQRSTKTATIEIDREDKGIIIRQQASKRAREISDNLKKIISEASDQEVVEEIISLEAFSQPEARSYFFEVLINSVSDFELETVKQVDVNYSECEDEDDVDESNSDWVGHIQKAILNGHGVLQSAEFVQLHDSGFYITKIAWTSTEILMGGDKVEFYAGFDDSDNCSEYKYLVRYVYGNKGPADYNKTSRSPSSTEKKVLTKKLEEASKIAHQAVVDKFGVDEVDEGD